MLVNHFCLKVLALYLYHSILTGIHLNRTLIIFEDKLRFHYLNATSMMADTTDNIAKLLDELPPKKVEKKSNFLVTATSLHIRPSSRK